MSIGLQNRAAYYHVLQEYQMRGNIRPTIELLLKEYGKLRGIVG